VALRTATAASRMLTMQRERRAPIPDLRYERVRTHKAEAERAGLMMGRALYATSTIGIARVPARCVPAEISVSVASAGLRAPRGGAR
jgi:hypothetical protein